MDPREWKFIQIRNFNVRWYFKKNRFAFSNRFNIVKRVLTHFSPKIILDLGTADGEIPSKLILGGKFKSFFIGIDISKDLIHLAAKTAKNNKIQEQIQHIVADLEYLPFRESIFDTITCTAVLEHLIEPEKALKEMARVCRSNKIIIITIPNYIYHVILQLLAFLRLRYKDLIHDKSLKIEKIERLTKKYELNPIFKFNFVLPVPKSLGFIENFMRRLNIKGLHPFLNQLLICKKD